MDAACCHCIQQLLLLYLGALICIAKLFQTDHEALRHGTSEMLILLDLIYLVLEVPITSFCENQGMRLAWNRGINLKHRQLGRES